jgi:biopolymer transport protein ExbD
MIDVVFLLIIFFLVSSHLARQETQMELALPAAQSGAEDIDQETPRVTINVKPDGSMWLAGRVIEKEQLAQRLKAIKSSESGEIEVRIRGSKLAPYGSVEPIMLACTQAGIWNVTYAVYGKEP